MIGHRDSVPAARHGALRHLGDRLNPIAPHRMHLVIAAIVLDVNDIGDVERDEPDHLGPAQEGGAERTTAGYLMLLSAFDNGALYGGREAVLEHFEDDARRRRTDTVNAWQDASIEQIGQRTFESPYRGRRTLVAPAPLGRALDPGEVTKRRADDAVDVDERPPLKYPSANGARTNELAGRSWTRLVTDATLESGVAAEALRFVPRHARGRRARSDHLCPWFRRRRDGTGLVHRATRRCEVANPAA